MKQNEGILVKHIFLTSKSTKKKAKKVPRDEALRGRGREGEREKRCCITATKRGPQGHCCDGSHWGVVVMAATGVKLWGAFLLLLPFQMFDLWDFFLFFCKIKICSYILFCPIFFNFFYRLISLFLFSFYRIKPQFSLVYFILCFVIIIHSFFINF